jgi:hypothetical protein
MPQEKYKYMEIDIFIRFRCKDGYVGFDLFWHGWKNWVMINMMMMDMEMKTMMMVMMKIMMSLSIKTLPYHQGMHLV